MNAVLRLSGGKERFLLSPYDLLAALPAKLKIGEEELEHILQDLQYDKYFDVIPSDRKGEKTYVVHLLADGLNYVRTDSQRKRSVYFRWGVVAIGAVISAVIGIVLKVIFS